MVCLCQGSRQASVRCLAHPLLPLERCRSLHNFGGSHVGTDCTTRASLLPRWCWRFLPASAFVLPLCPLCARLAGAFPVLCSFGMWIASRAVVSPASGAPAARCDAAPGLSSPSVSFSTSP